MSMMNADNPQSHSPADFLRREYMARKQKFDAQPAILQRYLEAQARQLAESVLQKPSSVRFSLPDKVLIDVEKNLLETVPSDRRDQKAGSLLEVLSKTGIAKVLRTKFKELEQSEHPGISASACILRYATCRHMVVNMLPAGRSVRYIALEDEEIPSMPDPSEPEVGSAITASTDAIAEEGTADAGRGELQVPYVPFARRFFLPPWVSFDSDGKMLAKSVSEAEAHIASMQQFLAVLHTAVDLAAYFTADEEYQRRRYGMLGQLVNQGRAFAMHQTKEIIGVIQRRAAAHDLNRGLSISLPYFDDQSLKIKMYPFEVIPAGRIMFVPAFVVRAAQEEAVKVDQDTRLSPSTRKHILAELAAIAEAFRSA